MKVYEVSGSEDGTIGIYGSKKRAVAAAVSYVEAFNEGSAIVKEHADHYTGVSIESSRTTADVMSWVVE